MPSQIHQTNKLKPPRSKISLSNQIHDQFTKVVYQEVQRQPFPEYAGMFGWTYNSVNLCIFLKLYRGG